MISMGTITENPARDLDMRGRLRIRRRRNRNAQQTTVGTGVSAGPGPFLSRIIPIEDVTTSTNLLESRCAPPPHLFRRMGGTPIGIPPIHTVGVDTISPTRGVFFTHIPVGNGEAGNLIYGAETGKGDRVARYRFARKNIRNRSERKDTRSDLKSN